MASSGGYICEIIIGKGGYNFYLKIFVGFGFETLHLFLKTNDFPWDVISDRSLTSLSFQVGKDCLYSLFEQVGRR